MYTKQYVLRYMVLAPIKWGVLAWFVMLNVDKIMMSAYV